MYEMHVGAVPAGTGPAWHVVAPGHATTLCGQVLDRTGSSDTDHHCTPCMARLQELMHHDAPH
ncbi:hypothetical protein [Streptomyces litmocidini]|uniref:hypothetical protein n=1 Tax=Streptomyces litmocidini TaxID=67318 RepID=UPI00167D5354|nr:hypothetical protein [Streptomyces litmocidini]